MKTLFLKVDAENPDPSIIQTAAEIIQSGGLVAFPTETVYGLGADALNPVAVKTLFMAKKRPSDNPPIVHVADKTEVCRLVDAVPPKVQMLCLT
jgi:L-threonylcarbamoyladenylate synthase